MKHTKGSECFKLAETDWQETLKIFGLGVLGVIVTYSAEFILSLDTGEYRPIVVALVPALVRFLQRWLGDTREFLPETRSDR